MTENSSDPDTDSVLKIKTQNDEEQNYYIVEELDEIENPLELGDGDFVDYDVSMEPKNDEDYLPPSCNRTTTIVRRCWDYTTTREMLKIFIENKRYIDRLMTVKNKYTFIAKKLNDINPDHRVSATEIENKLKALIRKYRANRSRKHAPINNIDQDLEEIYGTARLMKGLDAKSELFENKFEDGGSSSGNISLISTEAEPNVFEKIKISRNTSESSTHHIQIQAQATQTESGDSMLMQMVQIEKNQQKRWDEEKALIARIERAKAERFARKEALLQELVNVIKSRIQ